MAKPFREMAERIEHNKDAPFGGAFVIIDKQGNKVETFILDEDLGLAQFWAIINTRCVMKLKDIESNNSGFPVR